MSVGKTVAHYKRGPQGQMIADYGADYLATYGKMDAAEIARLEISAGLTKDRRDNRDPVQVGAEILASRGHKVGPADGVHQIMVGNHLVNLQPEDHVELKVSTNGNGSHPGHDY